MSWSSVFFQLVLGRMGGAVIGHRCATNEQCCRWGETQRCLVHLQGRIDADPLDPLRGGQIDRAANQRYPCPLRGGFGCQGIAHLA